MKISASTLIASLMFCGASQAQPRPTLSLDFEDGVNATTLGGKVLAPRVAGKAEIVEGKFGKAFKSGPTTGYLHFPTKDVLRAESGTVEMWVSPLDWSGNEKFFHTFFDVRGEGALYLYKFWQGGLLMLSAPDLKGPFHSASAGINDWKPGEWHHIAGTWSPHSQSVYVDGKKLGGASPGLPKSLGAEFMIGDNPWSEGIGTRTSHSLIDRVRIYDRILSDEHIAAHFAGDYDKVVPLSEKTSVLDYTIHPTTRQLSARFDALGVDYSDDTRVAFSLARAQSTLGASEPQPLIRGSATAQIPLADLKPGDYTLAATVQANGVTVMRLTKTVTVPSTEWLGNKLGMARKVLAPWTPLKVAPRKNKTAPLRVSCWGRTYEFADAPLPTQIISAGAPMLSRPVTLNIVVDGKPVRWTNGQIKVLSSTPTDVDLEGTAQAATARGNIELKTRVHLEFDGLVVLDFDLKTPAGAKIESLALDVSMRSDKAIYRHRWSPEWTGTSGNLPAGNGVVDKAPFIPFAWLGDNDRGLFWFCESGQKWPNFQAENAFETVRENNAVSLRFNLLDKSQTLPANWKFQCGLQATPVKAIPRDWRKWRIVPATRANVEIVWPNAPPNNKNAMKHFGSPIATDPVAFAERVKKLQASGVKVVPYSWLTFVSADIPEWKWFAHEWHSGQSDTSGMGIGWGAVWEGTDPYSRSFSDYTIWRNHQFLRDFKLDGYYHDQAHPYTYLSPGLNHGWRDAKGQMHPIYPILAYRDLYRRLYAMTKDANPDAFLMAHMSGKVTIPFLSFEDSYLDGENFREKVKDSYMDMVGLDYWRAELMGRQWGLMPFFLPEFDAEHAKLVEPTRGLAALVMLHDISVWPIWSNITVWNEMYDALDAFGYVDSDFIPYFDPTPPATTDMKDVYISVYKRRDGRALAIIANTSRENRSGTVTLNAKRIGIPTDKVLAWPDKSAMSRNGDKIKLDVPRLGYRMLLIGKAP